MIGRCVIERCDRAPAGGQPLCNWHHHTAPADLSTELKAAWHARHRAIWQLGEFRGAGALERLIAKLQLACVVARINAWWSGAAA
jgi:hypothetical protein